MNASSYSNAYALKRLSVAELDALNFTDFYEQFPHGRAEKMLDDIFPKTAAGQDDVPPEQYLVSGNRLRQWRSFSFDQQNLERQRLIRQGTYFMYPDSKADRTERANRRNQKREREVPTPGTPVQEREEASH